MKKTYIHIDTSGDCFEDDKIILISGMKVDKYNNILSHFYEDIPAYSSPTLNQNYSFQNFKSDDLIISNVFRDKLAKFKNFILGTVLISHYKYYEIEFLRRALKNAGLGTVQTTTTFGEKAVVKTLYKVLNDPLYREEMFDATKQAGTFTGGTRFLETQKVPVLWTLGFPIAVSSFVMNQQMLRKYNQY